jgi:beta-lactam-binding protein with PASTA domain
MISGSPAEKPAGPARIAAVLLLLALLGGAAVAGCQSSSTGGSTDTGSTGSGGVTEITPPLPPGTVAVPKVVGTGRDAAEAAIKSAGLVPIATTVVTTTVEAGQVLAQAPTGDSGLKPGSQVALAVAVATWPNYQNPIALPNTYQLNRTDAQSAVMNAGFSPAFVEGPSDLPVGIAVAQLPAFGGTARPGTTVLVMLSNGTTAKTASIRIPDVVGKSEAAAAEALQAAGLGSQVVRGFDAAPAGQVFSQLPSAGGLIGPDAPIALGLSLGPLPQTAEVAVPKLAGLTPEAAADALTTAGFRTQEARINDGTTPAGKVTGQVPPAGWLLRPGWTAIACVTVE